jgi:hypothetical protein
MKKTLVIECECEDCNKKDEEIAELTKVIDNLNIELLKEKLRNNTVDIFETTTTSTLDDIFGVEIKYMEFPYKNNKSFFSKNGEQ